jgi:CRP-like cAMP-binding protein
LGYLRSLSTEQNSHTITLPISKKQLADYFGVQRPSLFRELKKMKEEGLINIDNKTITLYFIGE